MPLEGALLLCSFSRMIVVNFPLGPMSSLVSGSDYLNSVGYGFHLRKWASDPITMSDWLLSNHSYHYYSSKSCKQAALGGWTFY